MILSKKDMIESVIKKNVAKIATIIKTIIVVVVVSLRFGQTILDASWRLCCINLKMFVTINPLFSPCIDASKEHFK